MKNISQKIIPIALALALILASGSGTVLAQTSIGGPVSGSGCSAGGNISPSGTFGLQNPLSCQYNTVGGLVSGFIVIFSYLAIIVAVLLLIWVGLQFVLARGNPGRIDELKSWLLWIVVGVAVVIGARIIVNVVITTLDSTGVVNSNVINAAHNAANNN